MEKVCVTFAMRRGMLQRWQASDLGHMARVLEISGVPVRFSRGRSTQGQ
jgi:hypothetical protein